jgi:hypothetical protein
MRRSSAFRSLSSHTRKPSAYDRVHDEIQPPTHQLGIVRFGLVSSASGWFYTDNVKIGIAVLRRQREMVSRILASDRCRRMTWPTARRSSA